MWIYQANPSTSTADSHQVNSAYGQDRIQSGPSFQLAKRKRMSCAGVQTKYELLPHSPKKGKLQIYKARKIFESCLMLLSY